ncbi:WASH complex subunit 2A-like isoform X2 [Spea bombifrons]|uniref:WASH complex subunit 2A-like isoform X2 n=1 Tax=Spea bombifrons TaxID=233779 RepID=UPI00234BACE8|nr:WASH complex subunit 2A-like isoform X2 [Spea bombifrons]
MNGPLSSAAEEAVWERPWSLDEIRRSNQNWSLGADAGLLNFLKEFSQQTISRTHEIEKQLDGLIHEAKATDCRLHNVFNDFLMLSNTQFIENRVYDEEIEEHVTKPEPGDKPEQEKSREQKEAELIPKIQEAVNYGLQVLESAFEQLDIKAGNSDSEEEDVNGRVDLILEPKDLYIDRPLPYLIGSQLFMQQEDVGLGDVSSEEGSVDNDRGSIIDSDEEEEKDYVSLELSDEDEDNGSDLFGDSDKEEEETERSIKTRTKSFADELAERIQGDIPKKLTPDQSYIESSEVKSKKEKEKKEPKKAPSDDEDDDDIFKPPKLTDDDFSPFGSKGHLFSGGKGLFDDDEEGDLFVDTPKIEAKQAEIPSVDRSATETLPANVKKKPPVGGVSLFPGGEDVIGSSVLAEREKKLPTHPVDTAPKLSTNVSLFDDEDGLFGSGAAQPTAKSVKAKPAADLFSDENNLFPDEPSVPPVISKTKETGTTTQNTHNKSVPVSVEKSKPPELLTKKQTRGLFSDEDDSETDLFSPSQSAGKSKPILPATKNSKSISLFDDEDEEDFFGSVPEKQSLPASVKSTRQLKLLEETKAQSSGLFSSDDEDPGGILNQRKTTEQNQVKRDSVPASKEKVTEVKKTILFDEEDDLFAITKESQKNQRVSLLFEDEDDNEGTLFSSKVAPVNPAGPDVQPSKMSVPTKACGEKESLFKDSTKKDEPKVSSVKKEPMPINDKAKQATGPEDVDHGDLFATSPPADKTNRSKNILSLFEEEEEDNVEDRLNISKTQHSGKTSEKSSHGGSTGVFQDEELLFSQELQKDNDPDVDLFANTKKPPTGSSKLKSEKPSNAKSSPAVELFGEEEDDLFGAPMPKKLPPKVQEKKTVVKRDPSDVPKNDPDVSEPRVDNVFKTSDAELCTKPAGPAPIKTKSPSSRIGKLQANLLINPASMLPGAVPKLPGAKCVIPGHDILAPHVTDSRSSADQDAGERVSFENPARVDTLHNANKTRAKVGGKRRPPTRMGRRLASQDSGEAEDLAWASSASRTSDKPEAGSLQSSVGLIEDEPISTMKLSLSENDIQSSNNAKLVIKPLTPDINSLLSSDIFTKSQPSNPPASVNSKEITHKPVAEDEKKSRALVLNEDESDDDLFQVAKQKTKKLLKPTSLDYEPDEDLFRSQKVEVKHMAPKEDKLVTSDIFEDDIFATESTKPVKKTKEKKPPTEPNLFDDNVDLFADLSQKSKDKKAKKKVEPKSIFDDDMDDIFSSASVKKAKPKVKPTQPTEEAKSDSKTSNIFDDPLNVFGN